MHAGKLLLLVVLGGSVLLSAAFALVPGIRPPIVKKWFRSLAGFTPANTPQEALDKFKDCLKKREYETAADLYCTGEYQEQMKKVAKPAKELGEMIDSLVYNMDTKGVVNPSTKVILELLEPFPSTFQVLSIKEKEDGVTAIATIGNNKEVTKLDQPPTRDFFSKHEKMINALVPVTALNRPLTQVELVKDSSGYWKLNPPVSSHLRITVDYLKDNATNYRNAIQQVRDEVKNDPVTKEGVHTALIGRLNESK